MTTKRRMRRQLDYLESWYAVFATTFYEDYARKVHEGFWSPEEVQYCKGQADAYLDAYKTVRTVREK
jgi:hypothetical protein